MGILAAGIVALFALLSRYLYRRIGFLRTFSIQPPLIGGLLLFGFGSEALNLLPAGIGDTLKGWPSVLVSFLFAALIFSEPLDSKGRGSEVPFRDILQQVIYVWFLALGQLAVGFLVVETLLAPFGHSPLLAHIIEIGWTGGHGSASALLAVMEHLGDRVTGELGIFSATFGLIWGGVSGMFLVHHFSRRYSSEFEHETEEAPHDVISASGREAAEQSEGVSSAVFLIALTVGVSYLVRDSSIGILRYLLPESPVVMKLSRVMNDIPVFFITILLAYAFRKIIMSRGVRNDTFGFLTGPGVSQSSGGLMELALELLIICAVGTIHLAAFLENLFPFLLLMLAAIVWTGFALLFCAKRMLPVRYWKELGILNYGMATGITAVGLMLLRNLPGSAKKRGILIYGLAAPYSAPFIGGGILSLVLPGLTALGYGRVMLIVILPIMIALFLIGKGMNRQRT